MIGAHPHPDGTDGGGPPLTGQPAGRRRSSAYRGERLRHAASLFSLYWFSKDWKFAWAVLIAIATLDMTTIYAMVWANDWQQLFYDSIQNKAGGLFLTLVMGFIVILAVQIGITLIRTALSLTLNRRWRGCLTDHYLDRWFARDRYYEIERLRLIDNPDQRIAEDIQRLTGTGGTVSLLENLLGLLSSVIGAVTFSTVLFRTAQPLHLSLFGYGIAVPGDTVWYGWVYATIGAFLVVRIGRPFVRRAMRQQQCEGDFRAGLLHVRRNAGQISVAGAQSAERHGLHAAFESVQRNYLRLAYATLGLQFGQGIYERVGTVLPLFASVPRYFRGEISFGQVMGAQDAFGRLTGALSYFVQAYGQIGAQIANINRLKALDDALSLERPRGIAFEAGVLTPDVALSVEGLRIDRIDGAPLLHLGAWTVRKGERWVVRGPSGSGKSTLLRALAGLWPDGTGIVRINGGMRVMVVPQRLYIPLGTLRDALLFAGDASQADDAALRSLLHRVGLDVHGDALDQRRSWQEDLSPGEQQRMALARILLERPDMVVLDEATSALDADNAGFFFEALRSDLPDLTIVNVVHDERLERFHDHRLTIVAGTATASTGGIAPPEDY